MAAMGKYECQRLYQHGWTKTEARIGRYFVDELDEQPITVYEYKVYSYETKTGRTEMKLKGMTQNGYTGNILDLDQATGESKRTERNLNSIS